MSPKRSRTKDAHPPVHLLSCVSTKLDRAARAEDLYASTWFKKARAYVTRLGAPWRILSAKHGLVDPGKVIAPYEMTLNTMRVEERRRWATHVLAELDPLIRNGGDVVILAGERYRQFLMPELEARGVRVTVPMRTLRQGEQLRWLNAHTRKRSE